MDSSTTTPQIPPAALSPAPPAPAAATEAPATPAPRKPGRPAGSKTRRPAGAGAPMIKTAGEETPPAAGLAGLFTPTGSEPAAPSPKGGRPRAVDTKDAELRRILSQTYERAAAALALIAAPAALLAGDATADRLAAVAKALKDHGDTCAASLVEYSRTNPKLRKMIENIGQGSGALTVLFAHGPILAALFTPAAPRASVAAGETSAADGGVAAVLDMANLLFAPSPTDAASN